MLRPYRSMLPRVHETAYVDVSAQVIGDVEIGGECIVAAGSLLTEGTRVPPRSLVLGRPAEVQRQLGPGDVEAIRGYANRYVEYRKDYMEV